MVDRGDRSDELEQLRAYAARMPEWDPGWEEPPAGLWERINLVNLRENILPTRPRADLILSKGLDHAIKDVALRRL